MIRLARLFGVRPASVERWTPREVLAASAATKDDMPLESWMPLAMAELASAWRGGTPKEALKRWGFDVGDGGRDMKDGDWLAWAGLNNG